MEIKSFSFTVGVTSGWVEKLSAETRATVRITDGTGIYKAVKCIPNPEIGTGEYCFLQLNDFLGALYVNMKYTTPYHVKRLNPAGEYFLLRFSGRENIAAHSTGKYIPTTWLSNTITLMDCNIIESIYLPAEREKYPGPDDHGIRIFMKREYAISMASRFFDKQALSKVFNNDVNTIFLQRDMDIRSLQILDELSRIDMMDPAFCLHLSSAAFSLIANFQQLIKDSKPVIARLHNTDVLAIESTMQYMSENLESRFPGITTLASLANMSPTKYKRLFKKIFNLPPQKVFINKKMEIARYLLSTGNYKVAEVAFQLGYVNPGFFSRQFKQHFGITPKNLPPGKSV